jgi:chemotaxis protein CheZ
MPDGGERSACSKLEELRHKLINIRHRHALADVHLVTEVVRAVLTTVTDYLTAKETALLHEVEELGRTIAIAKSEIAALRVDDITDRDIPFATDELDAIVDHTAQATNAILESCEMLDELSSELTGESGTRLQEATTKIYEACSFQDITGQRISKVVTTLKAIETKIAHIIVTFGNSVPMLANDDAKAGGPEPELLNGPQLPAHAMDQSDIDRLLASFE